MGLVDIWNKALRHIGMGTTIKDPDERSDAANILGAEWPFQRDSFLRRCDWSFARAIVSLTAAPTSITGDAETYYPEWSYAYQYPPDCTYLRRLGETRKVVEPAPYKLVTIAVPSGPSTIYRRFILTDLSPAIATYTRTVGDQTELYDPLFIEAVSLALAANSYLALKGKGSVSAEGLTLVHRLAAAATQIAEAVNLNEGQEDMYYDSRIERIMG